MIKSLAAICVAPHLPFVIDEIWVDGPRTGEVLVEIAATGLCHTDLTAIEGSNSSCVYPAVLGHEGAGRVIETGPGVSTLRAGDHVIPLYGPECGVCKMCLSRRTNLCWSIKPTRDRGVMPDGSPRFQWQGEPLHHFMGTSTFSRYTVVPEIALAKIRKDAPLDTVCLLGCGVTTGVGAALADVREGDNVVVFGLGGIGVNIVQGARIAGANAIIGVDLHASKAQIARELGMTHYIDASAGRVLEEIRDLCDGGADAAFECTGHVAVMRQALDCCHAGWGTCVLLGVEPRDALMSVPPVAVRYGRTVKGSYFGGVRGRTGLGRIVDLYMDGQIDIGRLVTHRLPFDQINRGFELMVSGESLRSVVSFE
ncbi:zinc-binding dehydrogenase [Caballeronia sp. dw_19]|uniref:zinc-binding dehydrogenase n=1 Tax=Caballeronia sp. dw_19 TaxID=2719791 RepID=UPI001BD69967|nr:zinc-binding dehydrogenase [Caballeronia sp. dw_19]